MYSNTCSQHDVLFDLGGIETEEYRPEHNFIGPDYDTNRTRYIRDNVDYDKLLNK